VRHSGAPAAVDAFSRLAVRPVDEMARAASQMVMERIAAADPSAIPVRDRVFAPHLVVGESARLPTGR
jgi:DNA-binding LacI/PurR family transcriptional regulator